MAMRGNRVPPVVLRVRGVAKRFGEVAALTGVDLDLAAGEWLGLLGPNGAGKTTLMRILSGLLTADAGRFELLGLPLDPTRSARTHKAIGVVPQEIALYPALSATENLRVFARLHGVERQDVDQRVRWALEWTGLEDRAHDQVSTYSGGMQRRLNIACAVLHEPRVVLLDEPTVGVDPQARRRIWTMLKALKDAGTSLIHSSHQLDEIESTCNRVLIMDHGRIVGEGDLEELVDSLLGRERRLQVRFNRSPDGCSFGDGFHVDGRRVSGATTDLVEELGMIVRRGEQQGLAVVDVRVDAPGLEDIFTAMTGQELRD